MITANTTIQRTRHAIFTLEELRCELNKAQYFTKLGMKHGYMEMELDRASRPITTFYTHRGLQRSCRLTFGINTAAEVFHKEIHQTLADIPSVRNIYEDILKYGKTKREHNLALIRVLQYLQDCGLTLNFQKCIFSIPQIKFFGVIFSAQGVALTRGQTTALLNATRLTTTTEAKSFLGMANFCAYFISEFSSKAVPRQALAMKNAKFTWSNECEQVFTTIKKALCMECPSYGIFWSQQTKKLIIDGSIKTGLSSILKQLDPRMQQHQVKQRYSQIDIKSTAIKFGVTKNHIY